MKKRIRTKGRAHRPTSLRARVVVGAAVIVTAAAGWALWSGAPPAVWTGAPPRVDIAQRVIDLGDVPFERWVTAEFTVRNAGARPLRIADAPRVRVVEGC